MVGFFLNSVFIQVDNNAKERPIREAIIQKLQEDLRNQTAPYEKGVAYAFPCADEHCGHFVKEVGYDFNLFATQSRLLTTFRKKSFENIVRKGENAGNQYFLLFPQCFLPLPKQISIFQPNLICRLQYHSNDLLFGKELILH